MISDRQLQVLHAAIAIYDYCERCMGGPQPVRALQVRHFGLPECVTDVSLGQINHYLRKLARDGLLMRADRAAEYVPTAAGRELVVEGTHR